MKKTLDKVSWKYKYGKFNANGSREIKEFGCICFEVELDPICGDGKIVFNSWRYPALNKTTSITAGMEEVERVIDEYYAWVRSLWDILPREELERADNTRHAIINRALTKTIMEHEGSK